MPTNLVLSRKLHENVIVRDRDGVEVVRVSVADIRQGRVRLAFQAEPDVKIDRGEVDERKAA